MRGEQLRGEELRGEALPASMRRGRGDTGAQLFEMALVLPPALFLLFGIIMFGATSNMNARLSQAATEAARDTVAFAGTPTERLVAAQGFLNAELAEMNRSCGTGGVACNVTVAACANSSSDCVTIVITLDNVNFPVFPRVPLFAEFMPDTLTGRSVEELSNDANP